MVCPGLRHIRKERRYGVPVSGIFFGFKDLKPRTLKWSSDDTIVLKSSTES